MAQAQSDDLSSKRSADTFKKRTSPEYIKPYHVIPNFNLEPAEFRQIIYFIFPPQSPRRSDSSRTDTTAPKGGFFIAGDSI
jgi:hypothetical protein